MVWMQPVGGVVGAPMGMELAQSCELAIGYVTLNRSIHLLLLGSQLRCIGGMAVESGNSAVANSACKTLAFNEVMFGVALRSCHNVRGRVQRRIGIKGHHLPCSVNYQHHIGTGVLIESFTGGIVEEAGPFEEFAITNQAVLLVPAVGDRAVC